jgi:lipoprotein-anchoring transpeptidase ErfK/SrfK
MRAARVAGAVATLALAAGNPAAAGAAVPEAQRLAVLDGPHALYTDIATDRRRVGSVADFRPITGAPTALPVVGRTRRDGIAWLRVRLPGRPNGHRGWIRERGTTATYTPWHVVVRTAARRVQVYRGGELRRTVVASVGTRATPTPRGRFFVEESVEMLPDAAGGPFALALSARSNVLQVFAGGPGQIAIHGIENLGGPIGAAVSHGCIRVSNRDARWLAARIGAGTPVTIRRT